MKAYGVINQHLRDKNSIFFFGREIRRKSVTSNQLTDVLLNSNKGLSFPLLNCTADYDEISWSLKLTFQTIINRLRKQRKNIFGTSPVFRLP